MSDLHARERHDADWGGLVVDLVEEDRVVGIVYDEDGSLFAEFYADEDGEAWVFEAADLQRALDTAAAILSPEEPDDGVPRGEAGQHPVDALALQFDQMAARRGPEDEGFYPLPVAARILGACSQLGLAMVYLEGVDLTGEGADPVPGHKADLGETNAGGPFPLFQAECNTQAAALLERWPRRAGFAVALEVQDAEGERFVL